MLGFRNRFGTRRVVEERVVERREAGALDDRVGDGRDERVVGGRGRGTAVGLGASRALARLVDLITLLVVLTIVIGIVLVLLKANPANSIVGTVRDAAKYLSKPFDAIFEIKKRRTEIAVNWGIAAAVYGVVGRIVARLISRLG